MKTLIPSLKTICLGLALITVTALQPANAQERSADSYVEAVNSLSAEEADRITQNFAEALRSDNAGVRESAVYHGLLLRILFPDMELGSINTSLQYMLIHEPNPRIRHKAHIALYFLEHDALHELRPLEKIPRESEFFYKANEIMNHLLLSVN